MAIANPKFVKAEVFDPAFYAEKKTTNVTITEALQALSGAIQTLKGTKVAKEVNINESKSIIVDQYAIIVNTSLDIDEVQTIFSALQTYKDESGYFIQDGGYIELTASEDKHITLKHSTAIGGVNLLGKKDILLGKTPILIMKNGDFWEEQISPARIATDEEVSLGLKEDVAINPKQLTTKANLDLGNVSEVLSENFKDKILDFLVDSPELNASLECTTFSRSTNWIAPSGGIAIAICLHGGGGGGGGGSKSAYSSGGGGGAGGGANNISSGAGGGAGGIGSAGHLGAPGGLGGIGITGRRAGTGAAINGGGGGGGGVGGAVIEILSLTKGQEANIVVGAGGLGGAGGVYTFGAGGGVGGISSVGSSIKMDVYLYKAGIGSGGNGGRGGNNSISNGLSGATGAGGSVQLIYLNKQESTDV